ncbi:MAG: MBL fold metallo-hydrolase [Bdellovibrionia bacterium]
MRIHHLNCISTCPLGGKLMDERTESLVRRGHLTCHCLLVETDSTLILIDTGFGLFDVKNPTSRLSKFFLSLVSPEFREEMTAIRQIERLGLDDFPDAMVHLLQAERDLALAQKTWLDRQRFRPQQWTNRGNWVTYQPDQGESWFGFSRVKLIKNVPPEIVMIPLVGHTFGHSGVAVREKGAWKLLAGDAYFFYREMNVEHPWCTPGLRLYQFMLQKDGKSRINNQRRLRTLIQQHHREVTVFCSHDVTEFEQLSGRSAELPIEKLTSFDKIAS